MSELGMKKLNQSLGHALDLPKEFTLDLPKVVILGDFQIYIENHQGIHHYQEQQVIVNCSLGQLMINGLELTIKQISIDDLYIEGEIQSIRYNRSGSDKEGGHR